MLAVKSLKDAWRNGYLSMLAYMYIRICKAMAQRYYIKQIMIM